MPLRARRPPPTRSEQPAALMRQAVDVFGAPRGRGALAGRLRSRDPHPRPLRADGRRGIPIADRSMPAPAPPARRLRRNALRPRWKSRGGVARSLVSLPRGGARRHRGGEPRPDVAETAAQRAGFLRTLPGSEPHPPRKRTTPSPEARVRCAGFHRAAATYNAITASFTALDR